MFQVQGASRYPCRVLVVLCGKASGDDKMHDVDGNSSYPFPEITSFGRLEVQTLNSPSIEEFRNSLDAFQPNFVYLQGEQSSSNEVGPLLWAGMPSEEVVAGLFDTTTPTTVYLEVPDGEKLAEAIQEKGVPYVIYWKSDFSCFAACHFRHALLSVIQSSSSHTWDAFRVAEASFRLYCVRNILVLTFNNQNDEGNLGPSLLGEPPKIDVPPPEIGTEDEEEGSDDCPAIKIYDEYVNIRLLICGEPSMLDDCSLSALEDGLNALLSIEIRGSKLNNRISAVPPPLQAATFSRGVVTMRCDMTTASAAHISLLVSGSAQTCFDDLLMENHIKSEVIEKSLLAHSPPECEKGKIFHSHPRKSDAVACGATVFEVLMKVPTWASQVLRQLAPDISYRSLVGLGIAGVQGLVVAPFEKHDAKRFLFFCSRPGKASNPSNSRPRDVPNWLRPPPPNINRFETCKISPSHCNGVASVQSDNGTGLPNSTSIHLNHLCNKFNSAAMRPIPHVHHQKMLPFSTMFEADGYDGSRINTVLPIVPYSRHGLTGSTPISHRNSQSGSSQIIKQNFLPLNPLHFKKHGCERSPIHVCSEEEFLKDVMQFLILRGHNRLIPQGGLVEFPEAILNAKRLDLFNLYREVVSRGGFHVGNGINWKGQVFSKMSNHTVTNRMTGVGNTLKKHYETYLLEYELAHEDVDGECCILCHSNTAGDWVNCGICGEWAHFGCDRRQGLGAFKDYAKKDGLEYICPQCSISNSKKKAKISNGYS